jgi:hypothetical protein
MFLDAHSESSNRNSLGDGEHERRTGGQFAHAISTRGDDADSVDVRSSRVNLENETLLLEKAEAPRHDLAKLVSSGEPAELEIEEGHAVDVPARGYAGAERGEERLTEEVSSSHGAPRVSEGASARQVDR